MMTKFEIVQRIIGRLAESFEFQPEPSLLRAWQRWDSLDGSDRSALELSDLDAIESVSINPEEVDAMLDILGPIETFGLLVFTGKRDKAGVVSWMRLGSEERLWLRK
jgi:hypothetical protein